MVNHRVYIYVYREKLAFCILFYSFVIISINFVSSIQSSIHSIILSYTLIYTRKYRIEVEEKESHVFFLFDDIRARNQNDIYDIPLQIQIPNTC